MPATARRGFLDPAQQKNSGGREHERDAQQQERIIIGHGQRLRHDPAIQSPQRGGMGSREAVAVLDQIIRRLPAMLWSYSGLPA